MTPVHTPPEPTVSVRPTDGRMGSRCVYDPYLDPKLAKKGSGKAIYKDIIEKVT
jgi:histone-lysine N-methyltransferase SETD1